MRDEAVGDTVVDIFNAWYETVEKKIDLIIYIPFI